MNLLPESYKEELKYEAWRRFVASIGLYGVIVGVIANVLLLPSYFNLAFQMGEFQQTSEQVHSSPQYKKASEGERQITEANKLLRGVSAFGEQNYFVMPVIEKIFQKINNASTTLSSFGYTTTQSTAPAIIKMAGIVPDQKTIQAFTKDLETSGKVQFSIDDITQEKNISFNATLELKPPQK